MTVCPTETRTHVGNVRQGNEDALLSRPEAGLWVVADGMGGHQAGEYASGLIVESLAALTPRAYLADFVDQVEDCLIAVNRDLLSYAHQYHGGQVVGSTVVCLLMRAGVAVSLWVGDSRLYQRRAGRLQRVTRDHSRIEALIAEGVIRPEEADSQPGGNVLTRAMGAEEQLWVSIAAWRVKPGDRYLLCSDGLWGELAESTLARQLAVKSLPAVADGLVQSCLSGAARDNLSLVLVEVT